MKPVSYQNLSSSVHGGHPNLDHVLGASKVMYCEKCGFASTDAAMFNKHMMEHAGTRFYCFYCNSVSFSEAELNAHLKQHTSKYPFVCPHCGQGYMRRLCLVKHIDRLHSKIISQGPAKPGMTKAPQVPVCSALTSASTADPAPPRPVVRVSVPPPSLPAVRLGKDEQRGKTMDTNVSHATNGIAERSPFNGLIQHNRALTVSLPEEVSIPAGCLVELVEVKTVNGTKELKLRLVSQQENESVIKDTRTMVPQNLTVGKPLSSTINHPNTARSNSMGTCIVNRKQCEQKAVTVEHPAVVPVSVSNNLPNTVIKSKCGLKRPAQEIINLDSSPVAPKIPKTILSPVREGNSGTRLPTAPVSPKATSSTVASRGVINMLNSTLHPDGKVTGVSQRAAEERKLVRPEHFLNIPPRRTGDPKNVPLAVKVEPGVSHHKSNAVSKTIKEPASMSPQSRKSASPSVGVPVVTAAQTRPPAVLLSKDNVNKPFSLPRTPNIPLSIKTDFLSNYTTSEIYSRSQDVKFKDVRKEAVVSEPESFPVISSVFSLSQQPGDDHGPIKPLVMALRGIVMDKNVGSASATQNHGKMANVAEQIDKAPTTSHVAPVDTKNDLLSHDLLLAKTINDSVKIEKSDKDIQQPSALTPSNSCVKEEKNCSPTKDQKSSESSDSKPNTEEESQNSTCAEEPSTPDDPQQVIKTEQDISSKYLTVSLKRVQVGVWKKCKKGLKMRISRYKAQVPVGGDWTVIHPMPLKVDQLVKRPGPYQPVVVLNHPKPRVSAQGPRTDSFPDSEGSEVVPECQILKMRLSKVVGQKYEVMGYTVRVFP